MVTRKANADTVDRHLSVPGSDIAPSNASARENAGGRDRACAGRSQRD